MKYLIFNYFCFLLLLNFTELVYSQKISKIDSLKQTINLSKDKFKEIEAIIELADEYLAIDTDSAKIYYLNANKIAKTSISKSNQAKEIQKLKQLQALSLHKLGNYYLSKEQLEEALSTYLNCVDLRNEISDKDGLSKTYNNIGIVYSYLGDTDKSLEYYHKSLAKRKELHDIEGIAMTMDNIGILFQDLGQIDSAMQYFKKSLQIYDSLNLKSSVARVYNNIAIIYKNQGDIQRAIQFYNASLKISEGLGEKSNIANVLGNIGLIYSIQNDIAKALEYYNQCTQILEQIGDTRRLSYMHHNIGGLYLTQGMSALDEKKFSKADSSLKTALEYYHKSLIIKEQLSDKTGIATTLNDIGITCIRRSEIKGLSKKEINSLQQEALENYQKGFKISQDIKDKNLIASALNNLAEVYYIQENLNIALRYATESYQYGKELGYIDNIATASKILYQIHNKKGNYKQALSYFSEYIAMKDSINTEENYKLTQQKYFQYQYEKQAAADSVAHASELQIKNLALAKSEEERKKQRTILLASILGFIMVLGFSIVLFRLFIHKKRANTLLKEQNIKISNQQEQIKIEKEKSDTLLRNILPNEIAEELKSQGFATPRLYESVSVLFTDFKGFTKSCAGLTPKEIVKELQMYFETFDDIIEKHGLEKIKTIGDAYMCAGGLPIENMEHPERIIKAALEMQEFMNQLKQERIRQKLPYWELRLGVHTGKIIAGVVGKKKFAYDIWGNTVNIASRMETAGEPGRVNISESTYELIKDKYHCEYRGKIEAKNVGAISMYFVEAKIL